MIRTYVTKYTPVNRIKINMYVSVGIQYIYTCMTTQTPNTSIRLIFITTVLIMSFHLTKSWVRTYSQVNTDL